MPIGSFGGGSSGTGPVPSITGCFVWFQGDSIGTSNNNIVTYWKDDSGSGNNLLQASTSGVGTPIYISGVSLFNNHNIVRFSGIQNFLTTQTNNASLNFSPSSVTLFSVYSTPVMNVQHTIFSLDNSIGRNSSFAVAVNEISQDILNPSGWGFGWGKGGSLSNNGWFSLAASSTTNGFQVGSPNSLTIRHDRFRPQDGVFAFGLNGVDIATGIANTQVGLNNTFNIGNDQSYNNYFVGDVAEIVGYNHQLTDVEVSSVYNYLSNKYIGNNSGTNPGTPTYINFHNPSDLSGLFFWYKSTSIGVTGIDGSPVQYWPDDSGSGNNLSVSSASSGQWVFPTFYRNQINGYPTVRFINGNYYSYLASDINNSKLQFSQNDLSTFVVFKTSDSTTQQSIFDIEDGTRTTVCDIGLNYGDDHSFYFGSGPYNTYNYLTPSSTTFGTKLYDSNFMIRSDRFKGNELVFGRYGAELASGIINTYDISTRLFKLGYNLTNNCAFYGDVAEIIGYNRKLSDNETELVNNYLLQKYTPGNVGGFSLFIYSTAASSIYNDCSLFVEGGGNNSSQGIDLYTGSKLFAYSGIPFYNISIGNSGVGIDLFTQASYQQFPGLDLFLSNILQSSSNIPLYIGSQIFTANNTTLYMSGSHTLASENTSLYIQGGISQSGFSLFVPGSIQQFPPLNLYTISIGDISNNKSLFISGANYPSFTNDMSLFMNGASGSESLYNMASLYLEGGRYFQGIPLYLNTTPINTNPSAIMPLFIGQPYDTGYYNKGIDLYIQNNTNIITSNTKRFYLQGAASYIESGYLLPLYMKTVETGVQNTSKWTDLYLGGVSNTENSISMFMPVNSSINNGFNIYVEGKNSGTNNITLFINCGNPETKNSINLYNRGF